MLTRILDRIRRILRPLFEGGAPELVAAVVLASALWPAIVWAFGGGTR